jgi:hypothetical protein
VAIPERAYDYEFGSRSAIAWVMESNRVRTDKASGIRNDPNDWAIEHNDSTYILDLVGRRCCIGDHRKRAGWIDASSPCRVSAPRSGFAGFRERSSPASASQNAAATSDGVLMRTPMPPGPQ